MQRRDEVDVGEVDEQQPAFQFGLDVIALAGLHAVPFVEGDHQGATGLQHEAEQVEVVLDHALASVHDEDHHVGVLDRLQRLDHRELLDRLEDLAATPHAGGVDQGVAFFVALEGDVDAVARGAGLVIDDHPLFAEHAVDQSRLANVGSTDHGDLDAGGLVDALHAPEDVTALFRGRPHLLLGELFDLDLVLGEDAQGGFQQVVHAAPMGRRDGIGIADGQRAEFRPGDLGIDGVDLVGHQEGALVPLAQVLGDHLIGDGHAIARVH